MSQHSVPCPDHDDCTAVYLVAEPGAASFEFDGQQVAWVSHAHSDLHVACRNTESNEPCADCVAHPAWPANQSGMGEALYNLSRAPDEAREPVR